MAQYIPYNPVYIPEIQPYKPDFNFLGNIAQTKQSRYDASYKKIGEMYGNLLNSPMTRSENIEKRDAFFKSIDQDIKKMSGMDLSLQQNQDAAMQVFKGLYEDPDIVKDMAFTKNAYGQLDRGKALKLCSDPTKCDGEWWEGGDQAIQYKMQEFKNASREEALAMQSPEYTAHYNVEKMAIKAAKDAGFNMKVDTVKGGYIVIDGNGVMMQPGLADFFLHQFGNDPKVMKMYNTQGYLQRKNWVAGNLQNYGGDETKANLEYINKMMTISEKAKAKQEGLDEKAQASKNNKALVEDIIKKQGYAPDIDKNLKDVYSGLFLEEQVTTSAAEINRKKAEIGDGVAKNMSNLKYATDNIDQIVGLNLLKQASNTAATHYSNLTKTQEKKADPFALAGYHAKLNLDNSMKMAEQNFIYDVAKKKLDYEYDVKKAGLTLNALGEPIGGGAVATDAAGNKLEANVDARGASTKAGAINARDENYGYRQSMINKNYEAKKGFVNNFVTEAVNKFGLTSDNKQKTWLKGSLTKMLANTGISVNDMLNNNLTAADIKKLEALTPQQVAAAYAVASADANPNAGNGLAGKDFFSKSFYEKYGQNMSDITRSEAVQKQWETHFDNVAQTAVDKTKGDFLATGEEGKAKAEILDMFVKYTKRPFTEEEFETFQKTSAGAKMSALYADAHYKDYLPAEYKNVPEKDMSQSLVAAAKGKALDFYDDNASDALVAYYESYNAMVPSYRQATGLKGANGNALTSIAHGGTFDPMVAGEQTSYAADYLKTYDKLQSNQGVKVAFGDAAELPEETDAIAQTVINAMVSDAKNPLNMKDLSGRPRFKWHAQDIAGGDPNYVSMTIYPDAGYLGKDEFIGTEKKPGILAGKTDRAAEGITLFFPKHLVDNKYVAKFKSNPVEYQYEATGSVSLDMYPDVNVTAIKTDAGPLWQMSYQLPGESRPTIVSVPLSGDYDYAEALKVMAGKAKEAQDGIDYQKELYRKEHGTTNPEDVVAK